MKKNIKITPVGIKGYQINERMKELMGIKPINENNKVKRDVLVTDYLMKYQSVLFEVTAYLTNSNTHKRIMIHMCPELRIEQKLLDAITK